MITQSASDIRSDRSTPFPSDTSVPLTLESAIDSASPQPVTIGLPFPKGAFFKDDVFSLVDPNGRHKSLQIDTLARWSDGSVKWLLVDFVLRSVQKGVSQWKLAPKSGKVDRLALGSISIHESKKEIIVDTGVATFHLSPEVIPFAQVQLNSRPALATSSVRTKLKTSRGNVADARPRRIIVENRGPVRATVRYEGIFPGAAPCRFLCRVCFFAGTGLARVQLTLHNPRRARHRGGLWDLGDPGSVLFRELAMELGLPGKQGIPSFGPRSRGSLQITRPPRSNCTRIQVEVTIGKAETTLIGQAVYPAASAVIAHVVPAGNQRDCVPTPSWPCTRRRSGQRRGSRVLAAISQSASGRLRSTSRKSVPGAAPRPPRIAGRGTENAHGLVLLQ